MGAAQLGTLIGAFVTSLLFAAIWLVICKIIPALRRSITTSYTVAMILAALPGLLMIYGQGSVDIYVLAGTGLCILILLWQKKKAIRSQLRSNDSKQEN